MRRSVVLEPDRNFFVNHPERNRWRQGRREWTEEERQLVQGEFPQHTRVRLAISKNIIPVPPQQTPGWRDTLLLRSNLVGQQLEERVCIFNGAVVTKELFDPLAQQNLTHVCRSTVLSLNIQTHFVLDNLPDPHLPDYPNPAQFWESMISLANEQVLADLSTTGEGVRLPVFHEYIHTEPYEKEDAINRVSSTPNVEIGPTTRMLHFHNVLVVEHFTPVHFEGYELDKWLNKNFHRQIMLNVRVHVENQALLQEMRLRILRPRSMRVCRPGILLHLYELGQVWEREPEVGRRAYEQFAADLQQAFGAFLSYGGARMFPIQGPEDHWNWFTVDDYILLLQMAVMPYRNREREIVWRKEALRKHAYYNYATSRLTAMRGRRLRRRVRDHIQALYEWRREEPQLFDLWWEGRLDEDAMDEEDLAPDEEDEERHLNAIRVQNDEMYEILTAVTEGLEQRDLLLDLLKPGRRSRSAQLSTVVQVKEGQGTIFSRYARKVRLREGERFTDIYYVVREHE